MLTKVDLITKYIEDLIDNREVVIGGQVPSLTSMMEKFEVSRDTVIRAYKTLSHRGLIQSIPGKGYFMSNKNTTSQINLFLLLDELSLYKNTLVQSIEKELGKYDGQYRIFFHHYNPEMFLTLIQQNAGLFTHYAISPFPSKSSKVTEALRLLNPNRLILIDRNEEMEDIFRFVGQKFNEDLISGLQKLEHRINDYKRLIFLFPHPSNHPKTLIDGFKKFCEKQKFNYQIIHDLNEITIQHFDSFLLLNDNDLAAIIQQARSKGWKLGKDIGIISYNETPLKAVISEGITTISTDFVKMGKNLVQMILDRHHNNIHNPSRVIIRASF